MDFSIFSTKVCEKRIYLNVHIKSTLKYRKETLFSHTFVEKIEKSIHLPPVCKLYPTLLAPLSHTASSVSYEG